MESKKQGQAEQKQLTAEERMAAIEEEEDEYFE